MRAAGLLDHTVEDQLWLSRLPFKLHALLPIEKLFGEFQSGCLTKSLHWPIRLRIRFANSSGVLPTGSLPWAMSAPRNSGMATTRATSRCTLFTMYLAFPPGRAIHTRQSPRSPASRLVERRHVKQRRRPLQAGHCQRPQAARPDLGRARDERRKIDLHFAAELPMRDGATLLYGMCVMFTPARSLKARRSNAAACRRQRKRSEFAGLAFATRISSCTVLMPRLGGTTRTFVLLASKLMGAKSRTGS